MGVRDKGTCARHTHSHSFCVGIWPWTSDPLASILQVMRIQLWTTRPTFMQCWGKPKTSRMLSKHSTTWVMSPTLIFFSYFFLLPQSRMHDCRLLSSVTFGPRTHSEITKYIKNNYDFFNGCIPYHTFKSLLFNSKVSFMSYNLPTCGWTGTWLPIHHSPSFPLGVDNFVLAGKKSTK